jgi:hypothetical protein
MEKEYKNSQTVIHTKEVMIMENRLDMDSIFGATGLFSKGSLNRV